MPRSRLELGDIALVPPPVGGCGARHQRDDNAATNLARHASPVGPVGASVKRGADRNTRRAGQVAEKREVRKHNSERSAA